ncbi:FliI/YscN family ATPase [Caenimonas koreensis]|uniref:FliI/YscN family ATPase n=1 Tax=Caenimonas koreensis DSM 17982 TaxID=1121255 RepID=A0A844B653_9BURK|nr:FliI/YscN family ATPase [Caenimonas koreensis]MRD48683.1 FliI/YscN family ATPase [Caenimonas koreensis DSM 17982]
MSSLLAPYRQSLRGLQLARPVGHVRQLGGLTVEVEGLRASIGDMFSIAPGSSPAQGAAAPVLAEVVAVKAASLLLMPYGGLHGLSAGDEVLAAPSQTHIGVGGGLLGRVIDGFGEPLDGQPAPQLSQRRALRATPCNPMGRPRIHQRLDTGVRVIDSLLTLGQGQRMGIFAGSGVGKSTLLGMIARHVKADVNVIALIGERGREVRDFIDLQLGADGLARSVVVVAASDQPALSRLRAANAALAIAEYFRDQGQQVLLTMDSITRFAMARREVGLAAGEPPTARGYTPSVFSELPQLCERCGTAPSGGSITALMTVLVEGDDLNEPVSDNMRAILDGHIVLSRQLAHTGHYPAIDVLQSASRVMPDIVQPAQLQTAASALRTVALLERNRQLVDIGAYEAGSNRELDKALALQPALHAWMRQRDGGAAAGEGLAQLTAIVSTGSA